MNGSYQIHGHCPGDGKGKGKVGKGKDGKEFLGDETCFKTILLSTFVCFVCVLRPRCALCFVPTATEDWLASLAGVDLKAQSS